MLRAIAMLLVAAYAMMLPSPSWAGSVSQLRVSPAMGHPGDTLYLSGAGYPAHRRLSIVLGCPNLAAHDGSQSFQGPTTDARGQFAGFKLRALSPRKYEGCQVYAGILAKTFQLAPSQPYRIVRPGTALPRCVRTMCVRLKATLIRLRTGAEGNIAVLGWPGARIRIAVTDPAGHVLHRTATLDWRGMRTIRLLTAPGLQRAVRDRVTLSAQLGSVTGSASTGFIILPGGR